MRFYFDEAKKFGGVQIVRKVLNQDDDFKIGRSSLKETYDFILSDLDSAALLLPETNDRGRATKGAAYAMKMRVALQAGAYLNDNAYYQQVINAGNSLFALGKYSLDSYSNLFNSYGSAVASAENILIYDRLSTNTTFSGTPMQSLVPNSDNVSSKLTARGNGTSSFGRIF
ncbi:MAG: RagB/SusD family nutrient uptake outer membrane protein [Mangrovibacterium sp.]